MTFSKLIENNLSSASYAMQNRHMNILESFTSNLCKWDIPASRRLLMRYRGSETVSREPDRYFIVIEYRFIIL